MVLRVGLTRLGLMRVSIRMASWSPTPGSSLQRSMRPGLLVKNISNVFEHRVGKLIICSKLQCLTMSKYISDRECWYWFDVTVRLHQSMSGRLKSPPTQKSLFGWSVRNLMSSSTEASEYSSWVALGDLQDDDMMDFKLNRLAN